MCTRFDAESLKTRSILANFQTLLVFVLILFHFFKYLAYSSCYIIDASYRIQFVMIEIKLIAVLTCISFNSNQNFIYFIMISDLNIQVFIFYIMDYFCICLNRQSLETIKIKIVLSRNYYFKLNAEK